MSTLFGFIGMPGPLEMFVISVVILLLFGHRLPSVMRSLGRGVVEFKEGLQGVGDDLDDPNVGGPEEKPKVPEK